MIWCFVLVIRYLCYGFSASCNQHTFDSRRQSCDMILRNAQQHYRKNVAPLCMPLAQAYPTKIVDPTIISQSSYSYVIKVGPIRTNICEKVSLRLYSKSSLLRLFSPRIGGLVLCIGFCMCCSSALVTSACVSSEHKWPSSKFLYHLWRFHCSAAYQESEQSQFLQA